MSETVLSKEPVQPAPEAPVKQAEPAPQGRGNGLAVVALLLGAAGVAVGGWGVWQVRQLQAATTEQLSDVPALAAQTLSIKQGEQQLLTRLNQLPSASELDNQRQLVVQLAMEPGLVHHRAFAFAVTAVYGALSGLFAARTLRMLRLTRTAGAAVAAA